MTPIRVLVVDDYDQWRHFVCSTLQKHRELQVVGEASDGLEAVQKADELQPDLVLLDIGLPTLNGLESARRILELAPTSKILIVSENRSPDVISEALRIGASGYLVKSVGGSELLPAVEAVLRGKQFVGTKLTNSNVTDSSEANTAGVPRHKTVTAPRWKDFSMDFDPMNRVLRVSPIGLITDEVMIDADAAVRWFVAEEGTDFGIFDYSAVSEWQVTVTYVRSVANNPPAIPPMKLRIAIAPQPVIHAMNRTYSSLIGGRRSDFQLVETMKEAEAVIGRGVLDFLPLSKNLGDATSTEKAF